MTYTVERNSWLGRFQPKDCRGLIDYLDEKAFTASHLPLSEIPVQHDMRWQEIDDPGKVVVESRGTIVTTARYILIQGARAHEFNISYLGPEI